MSESRKSVLFLVLITAGAALLILFFAFEIASAQTTSGTVLHTFDINGEGFTGVSIGIAWHSQEGGRLYNVARASNSTYSVFMSRLPGDTGITPGSFSEWKVSSFSVDMAYNAAQITLPDQYRPYVVWDYEDGTHETTAAFTPGAGGANQSNYIHFVFDNPYPDKPLAYSYAGGFTIVAPGRPDYTGYFEFFVDNFSYDWCVDDGCASSPIGGGLPDDWEYPCTWVSPETGETMTGTQNFISNPSFEEGVVSPAGWSSYYWQPATAGSWEWMNTLFALDGVRVGGWNVLEYDGSTGYIRQTIDVERGVVYDGLVEVSRNFIPQVGYLLGACAPGAACDTDYTLSARITPPGMQTNVTINYDGCPLDSSGQYYECGWRLAEFPGLTFGGERYFDVVYTAPAGLAGDEAAIMLDGVAMIGQSTIDASIMCIGQEDAVEEPLPTPTLSPLATMPPLSTPAPLPTVGSVLPTPVNSGIGLTPMPTSCAGWSEFGVLSATVPALNVCLAPRLVDLSNNPVNDATGGEFQQWLSYMFAGFVAAAVIAYVRFR